MAATATAVRRTQAERRASSRARIIDATLACLADLGYAGASLPEIVRRAGLSNGALWRHFRSKAELLAAAAVEAEDRLLAVGLPVDLEQLDSAARIDAVVNRLVLWSGSPEMHAMLELMLASRTDPELNAALRMRDERMSGMFVSETKRMLGPVLADHPRARANVRQLGLLIYGVTLTQHLRSPAAAADLSADLRATARTLFAS